MPSDQPDKAAKAAKAARAAQNAQKLRRQLLAKAAARKKTTTMFSNKKTKRNRDDDDEDDDDNNDDIDDEAASGDATDDDREADFDNSQGDAADDADMVGQHRIIFMERAFSDDEEQGNNKICRPQKEIDEIIFLLEHWEVDTALKAVTDPEHYRVVKSFRETHRKGYKWVKLYWLHYIQVGDTTRAVLRRKESNHATGGRIVASRESVFDAIDEWHREKGHIGQERTHAFCRTKYYNCTQALVKIYCETCYVCMRRNPTVAPMKGSRKPIRSNGYRARFQIDLIDFRKMRKRDPFGVLMRWIVTVKDHSTGFTYVSAIPRKTAHFVAHRLQELFGLIGYPSIFHTDNGKEFTARAILKFLRNINPSIITVTGRPRKPSDQGSVESMNRLVKRLIGSELAQRRAAGENPNWTEILGSVTAAINSQCGRGLNAVPSYTTIFGQPYDQEIACSKDEACQCWTVSQRVKVVELYTLFAIAWWMCYCDELKYYHEPKFDMRFI